MISLRILVSLLFLFLRISSVRCWVRSNQHVAFSAGISHALVRDASRAARSKCGPLVLRCSLNVGPGDEEVIRKRLRDIMIPSLSSLRPAPSPPSQAVNLEFDEAQQLTDRVRTTVNAVRMKKEIFRRYVNDIQGVTGLGAVAAQEYVRNVIEQRQLVWSDLLMIVMLSRPVQVEKILLRTAREVLAAPIDPLQWVWFRDNLLSSYGWFARSRAFPATFVYEQLLAIAEEKIAEQAKIADAMSFPELEDVPSSVFFPGGQNECRQDHRMVGNVAGVLPQLLGSAENLQFYDLNVYLNQLLCISHIIDPQFQAHLASLFHRLPGSVDFQEGPPKNLARSRAKAQTDYADCPWPTCAHLLDLVRCSVTFETAEELRAGLMLLMDEAGTADHDNGWSPAQIQKKTHDFASFHAFGTQWRRYLPCDASVLLRLTVVRVKNGFSGGRGGYRDIKVNVLFVSDQGFAMIGEVALVLAKLRDYKQATHELYEILREREFFRQVVDALGDDWL